MFVLLGLFACNVVNASCISINEYSYQFLICIPFHYKIVLLEFVANFVVSIIFFDFKYLSDSKDIKEKDKYSNYNVEVIQHIDHN